MSHLAEIDQDDEIAVAKALNAINGKWDEAGLVAEAKYMQQLQEIADMKSSSVTVDLDDLAEFGEFGSTLAAHVQRNTLAVHSALLPGH